MHGFQLSMSDLKDAAASASKKTAENLFTNFEDVRVSPNLISSNDILL